MGNTERHLLIIVTIGAIIFLSIDLTMLITGIGEYSIFRMIIEIILLITSIFMLEND